MRQRKDMAASVKQRLLNFARNRREDFNSLLTQYAIERLLYRLSRSNYGADFVLKGAMLFHLWTGALHRPTRDVDLLGRGPPELARLENVFRTICAVNVEEDGLTLLADSVRAERIREDAEYEGVRIRLEGQLGSARIRLQVDVGFGDAVVPAPEQAFFPVLLDQPAPRLSAYRRETVVAEKLHAMVELGIANSRLRDFYDLRFLAAKFPFDGPELVRAIKATFARRQTPIPTGTPTGLTDTFAGDAAKQTQWRAFLRRSRLEPEGLELGEVAGTLREFLMPPVEAVVSGKLFRKTWPTGGPWQPAAGHEA